MDCAETRDRLVALDDGELGRSEEQHALAHLASCSACRDERGALARATPRAEGKVPPAILARLERMDVASLLAGAPPRHAGVDRFPRLGRRVQVPLAAVLAYVFALAAMTAWGLSNWAQNADNAAQLASQIEHADIIPGQAWLPAAYSPASDWEDAPTALPSPDDETTWH